jgi:hypothetical protein
MLGTLKLPASVGRVPTLMRPRRLSMTLATLKVNPEQAAEFLGISYGKFKGMIDRW